MEKIRPRTCHFYIDQYLFFDLPIPITVKHGQMYYTKDYASLSKSQLSFLRRALDV